MSVNPEKLASAVFLKEPIWNSRHAGHKNRTIVKQYWSNLSKEIIIDAELSDKSILRKRFELNEVIILATKTTYSPQNNKNAELASPKL
ncbi:hypothetical protein QTP88_011353 [Uroleucon formosanum]